MNLTDATLMFAVEAAGYPAVAELAQSAHDRLVEGEQVDYRVLDALIAEASGQGLLRALHAKYSPDAYDAIIMPVLQEIGRRKPIRSDRPGWSPGDGDPLASSRSGEAREGSRR